MRDGCKPGGTSAALAALAPYLEPRRCRGGQILWTEGEAQGQPVLLGIAGHRRQDDLGAAVTGLRHAGGALLLGGLLVIGALWASPARADDELRLKINIDAVPPSASASAFRPHSFVRTKQRFRGQGLVLYKISGGLRAQVSPHLNLQTHYAHKDVFVDGHRRVHMFVLDLKPNIRVGPWTISDRNGNEWPDRPGFYCYRNRLELRLATGPGRLRPFLADEVRFDSDQHRLNLNNLTIGADLRLGARLGLKAYVDLQSNRRSRPEWRQTRIIGVMDKVRI